MLNPTELIRIANDCLTRDNDGVGSHLDLELFKTILWNDGQPGDENYEEFTRLLMYGQVDFNHEDLSPGEIEFLRKLTENPQWAITQYRGRFYTIENKYRDNKIVVSIMRDQNEEIHTIFDPNGVLWTKEI